MKQRTGLIPLCLYAIAALADAGLHLAENPPPGTGRFAADRIIVATDAALFWPIDLVAMLLLSSR